MLFFILLFILKTSSFAQESGQTYNLKIIDDPEIVFNYQSDACDPDDIPDTTARAFKDDQGRIQLISTHHINRRMIGDDFGHLKRDCHIIFNSAVDQNPGHFQTYEWLNSFYTFDGKTIYALVHDEYHGWENPGQCASKKNVDCWYNAITSAVSTDSGYSYHHLKEAPKHLVAAIPYVYQSDAGPSGVFGGSNIIDGHDGYYYFLSKYRDQVDHVMGICIMRTQHLEDPSSWRAWDGQGFNISFVNPFDGSVNDPKGHLCSILSKNELVDIDLGSITYNEFTKTYLLIGSGHAISPKTGKMTYSFCFSLSKDLIHWSNRKYIMDAPQGINYKDGDPMPIGYPSAIDPGSKDRNFGTTGKEFYLYYMRYNLDRKPRNYMDRDLVRVRVELK